MDARAASDNSFSDTSFSSFPFALNPSKPIGGSSKRVFDLVLAALALLIALPLLVMVAALIWGHDRKNPFFGHLRVGRNGQLFRCWKFRSMLPNSADVLAAHLQACPEAAREWAETRKLRQDPRVTPVGRILRVSSLDELPQLYNVLLGQMSVVGPRPIVADEVGRYGADFNHYVVCRPGLTGLWQISGRSDTSYTDRVRFDAQYAATWSIWRDASIVARTVPVLLSRKGSY